MMWKKTRRDYLKDCSNYYDYDKYLNKHLMKEKGFWTMEEQDKVALQIRDRELAEKCWEDYRNGRLVLVEKQSQRKKSVQSGGHSRKRKQQQKKLPRSSKAS